MSRMRSPSTTELPLAIEFRVPVAGIEADLTSYARSQYRAQLLGGFWRIVAITSIYKRDALVPSVPGTRLDIDAQELTGYRPSYRCLAWFLSRRGLPPRPDLLGDDQPEAVTRQYEAEATWLTGSQPARQPGSQARPNAANNYPANASGHPPKITKG